MGFDILTLSNAKEWHMLYDRLPDIQKDIYYTPEYYSLYETNGDGDARCYVYEEGGAIFLYPFLINSVNSLGYNLDKEYFDIQGAYGYNGPISTSKDLEFIRHAWLFFEEYCFEQNIIAEFSRFHPLLKNQELSKGHFSLILDRSTVYLDVTQNQTDIFNGFCTSTRKYIRKAEKNIEIRKIYNTEENIEIFYQIYKENMEKVHSIPYLFFSVNHFRNMFKLRNIEFFLAYLDDIPIACYSGLVSKHYYGNYLRASRTDYNKTGVNTLMYWSMIQSAKSHGCHYVHFGGGSNSDPENSLLSYKMNFSKTLSHFYIGKCVHNVDVYNDVLKQWKITHNDSYIQHKSMLLGYREI